MSLVESGNGETMAMQEPSVLLKNQLDESSKYDTEQSDDNTELDPIPDIEVTDETFVIDPALLPNDVILVVEDRHLHVNQGLLESASPVFEAWLKKEWQPDQSNGDTKRKLEFPGKTYDEMVTFIKCLLPFSPDKVTDSNLDIVLPLADEYRTEDLITECSEIIKTQVDSLLETDRYIPPSRVVTYLHWVEKYNLISCKEYVMRLASYLQTEELEAVADYTQVGVRLQMDVSKARASLLESIFVADVTEAEKKMYQFKIPRSSQYMATWKKKLAELVLAFLATQPPTNKMAGIQTIKSSPSPMSLASNMKQRITPSVAATFACISICDRFNFSESYLQSITTIRSLVMCESNFQKLWEAHYASDSNEVRDHIERHVFQMCSIQTYMYEIGDITQTKLL